MNQSNHLKNIIKLNEARFEAIAQTASDSIIISDEESTIVFANRKTYEIFGYEEGSLIGSEIGILMPEKYRQGHKAGVQRFIETDMPKLIGHTVEIEGLRKDGTIFPLELSLSSWKEEGAYFFSGIIRDITKKKEAFREREEASSKLENQKNELEVAYEELKEARHLLQEITDAVPNVIYVSDIATKKIIFVNKEIATLAGYTSEEIKSFSREILEQMVHPGDIAALEKQTNELHHLKERESSEFNIRVRHRNGSWRWVRTKSKIFKYDENGKPLQTIRAFEDITEVIEAQHTIQQQNEELAATLEELQSAEEQLREINEELELRVEVRTKELIESESKVKQSEKDLRLITDAMPALISYLRSDGTYGFVNKAYEKLFQVNREDIIGKTIKEIIGDKAYQTSLPLIERALKGEFVKSEIPQDYGPEIGEMWRRASFVPHKVEKKIVGVFLLLEDITEFKNIEFEQEQANKKLQEKDEFCQALIKHGSDIITLFDEELNYQYCGGSILRELGYKPEQLIGGNALDFIHPEDISMIKEYSSKILNSREEKIVVPDFRFKNAKGEWRWLETIGSNQLQNPAVGALIFSSRDITEKLNNRLKLQENQQRFKSLFDNHLDIILFQKKEGVVINVNASTLSFLGIQKQEILNRPFSDFLPPQAVPVWDQTLRKALNGESLRFEMDIPFERKGICNFDIAMVPVEVNGEINGVYIILKDITERKEVEENQLQMTHDLFRQNRDLQQFTYIVSHNLRSPVASIRGLADLLTTTEDRGSEIYEVSLGYLDKAAKQLDTVLMDLNQILSIRKRNDTYDKEKIELALVCQQVITDLEGSLNECGGKVLMAIEEGTSVKGNKSYFYSIFFNLLSNAIKYRSPDRSLEVNIKCLSSVANGTEIFFADNGIGLDMEKVEGNIFKLYKRFHTNFEGRGIGLFLVKTHIEAMDGQIEANSQINQGTTFIINLP